jgi:hypothetical protein
MGIDTIVPGFVVVVFVIFSLGQAKAQLYGGSGACRR